MTERNPNALHDDCRMPIGKHKGQRLGDIPDHYWMWFLAQDWCARYPDLVEYALLVQEDY